MRYVRKKNTNNIVSKVLNFNQKDLPDPNAKNTTMDKFLKSHERVPQESSSLLQFLPDSLLY